MEHLHSFPGVVSKLRFGEQGAKGNVMIGGSETALGGPFFNPMNGTVQILRERQWVNAQVVSSLLTG